MLARFALRTVGSTKLVNNAAPATCYARNATPGGSRAHVWIEHTLEKFPLVKGSTNARTRHTIARPRRYVARSCVPTRHTFTSLHRSGAPCSNARTQYSIASSNASDVLSSRARARHMTGSPLRSGELCLALPDAASTSQVLIGPCRAPRLARSDAAPTWKDYIGPCRAPRLACSDTSSISQVCIGSCRHPRLARSDEAPIYQISHRFPSCTSSHTFVRGIHLASPHWSLSYTSFRNARTRYQVCKSGESRTGMGHPRPALRRSNSQRAHRSPAPHSYTQTARPLPWIDLAFPAIGQATRSWLRLSGVM